LNVLLHVPCTRFLGPEPSNNALILPMNRALRRDGMPTACLFGCSDPAHTGAHQPRCHGQDPVADAHAASITFAGRPPTTTTSDWPSARKLSPASALIARHPRLGTVQAMV